MSNKNRQNPTETAQTRDRETGLTPMQEKAALMLANGQRVTAVADELKVNRCTIYEWQRELPFVCFYNKQRGELLQDVLNGLCGLKNEALRALSECLNSENEQTRLKAATTILDKIASIKVGATDPRAVIKAKYLHGITDPKEQAIELLFHGQEVCAELEQWGLSDTDRRLYPE